MTPTDESFDRLLRDTFFEQTGASRGAQLLAKPRGQAVYVEALPERDAFNDLLEYYGLREIGTIARMLPRQPDADKEAARQLDTLDTYARTAGFLLPQLYRARLNGRWAETEKEVDETVAPTIWTYLDLTWELRRPTVQAYANNSTRGEHHLRPPLGDPGHLIAAALADPDTPDGRTVQGLFATLRFATTLEELLIALNPYPLLQAALWAQHAPLFQAQGDQLRTDLTTVTQALRQTRELESIGFVPNPAALERLMYTIEQLTSTAYADVLREKAPFLNWKNPPPPSVASP